MSNLKLFLGIAIIVALFWVSLRSRKKFYSSAQNQTAFRTLAEKFGLQEQLLHKEDQWAFLSTQQKLLSYFENSYRFGNVSSIYAGEVQGIPTTFCCIRAEQKLLQETAGGREFVVAAFTCGMKEIFQNTVGDNDTSITYNANTREIVAQEGERTLGLGVADEQLVNLFLAHGLDNQSHPVKAITDGLWGLRFRNGTLVCFREQMAYHLTPFTEAEAAAMIEIGLRVCRLLTPVANAGAQ